MPARPLRLAVLLLGLAAPLAARAEGGAAPLPFSAHQSLWHEGLATVDEDVAGIARLPFRDPGRTAAILGGIGLLVLFDEPLTRGYQNTVEPAFDGFALPRLPWEEPFTEAGLASEDVWLLSGLAGSYAWGALSGDERASRAALLSGKAVGLSFLTTQVVLKSAIARNRPLPDLDDPASGGPGYTDDPFDFGNYHGISLAPDAYGTAMPSYHFTQYFAVARVYSGVYGGAAWPYGLAGLLAVSNIRGHHHWVSDMAAGAVLGIGIGDVVLRNSDNWRVARGATATLAPLATEAGAGVTLGVSF